MSSKTREHLRWEVNVASNPLISSLLITFSLTMHSSSLSSAGLSETSFIVRRPSSQSTWLSQLSSLKRSSSMQCSLQMQSSESIRPILSSQFSFPQAQEKKLRWRTSFESNRSTEPLRQTHLSWERSSNQSLQLRQFTTSDSTLCTSQSFMNTFKFTTEVVIKSLKDRFVNMKKLLQQLTDTTL